MIDTFKSMQSKDEFLARYWLKEELSDIAHELGLSRQGSKAELTERIAASFDGIRLEAKSKSPGPKSSYQDLSPELVIDPAYKSDEKHRAFFARHLGEGFKFNVPFMNWMKEHKGVKTYFDAFETFKAIEAKKKAGHQFEIDSQFEYNRYTRAFFANNPHLSRQDCIRCWNYKKAKPGSHAYEDSDLVALRI